MGFIKFEIETYKVSIYHDFDLRYEIKIVSKSLINGKKYNARVLFDDPKPDQKRIGYIINSSGLGPEQVDIVFDIDQDGFSGFYQVLSTEKPVYLSVAFEETISDKPKNSQPVFHIQLTTDAEVPGDFEKKLNIRL
jgi:hypothetical protein